jgi:uncharacterized cupin superfamily protein
MRFECWDAPLSVKDTVTTTSMYFDANEDEGLKPSRLVTEETGAASLSASLYDIPSPAGTAHAGIWFAEPGTYNHPGGGHETFVVLEGAAEFDLPTGTVTLGPGSVAHIPAATPTVMRVTETLRKVSVVIKPA